jgi:hypothetical protein
MRQTSGLYEMAASTQIILDTTPPRVSFGTPSRYGSLLGIPYTINENGVLAASYVPVDGNPLTVLVLRSSFWVNDAPSTNGVLLVTTRDDVWNVGTEAYNVTGRGVGEVVTGRYVGIVTGFPEGVDAGVVRSRPDEATRRIKAYHDRIAWQVAYGVRIRKK